MQTTFALVAALASVAFALPQAGSSTPAGCSTSYNGQFQITIVNGSSVITKRELQTRSTCGQEGLLTATLADGVLTDTQGRIGNIVANRQFQFDPAPGQAGAIYTSGFSVCSNGSLAIAGSTIFYSCKSGDFANLYDQSIADYCLPVYINVLPCSASGGAGQATVSQQADGQPTVTTAIPVTQIGDGQPQGVTSVPVVTQIGDGQLQGNTAVPAVTQIADGQLQIPTGIPVTQIGDGQVQVPTTAPKAPATQIGDGQVQVPTTAPKAPATQIGDGQIQVPTTAAPAPATQIGDGQIQVPTTAAGTPVTQIGDGQLQSNVTVNTTAPVTVPVSAGNTHFLTGTLATVVVSFAAVLLL